MKRFIKSKEVQISELSKEELLKLSTHFYLLPLESHIWLFKNPEMVQPIGMLDFQRKSLKNEIKGIWVDLVKDNTITINDCHYSTIAYQVPFTEEGKIDAAIVYKQ